eukprot:5884532-Amphidinium_carterae.2
MPLEAGAGLHGGSQKTGCTHYHEYDNRSQVHQMRAFICNGQDTKWVFVYPRVTTDSPHSS